MEKDGGERRTQAFSKGRPRPRLARRTTRKPGGGIARRMPHQCLGNFRWSCVNPQRLRPNSPGSRVRSVFGPIVVLWLVSGRRTPRRPIAPRSGSVEGAPLAVWTWGVDLVNLFLGYRMCLLACSCRDCFFFFFFVFFILWNPFLFVVVSPGIQMRV